MKTAYVWECQQGSLPNLPAVSFSPSVAMVAGGNVKIVDLWKEKGKFREHATIQE